MAVLSAIGLNTLMEIIQKLISQSTYQSYHLQSDEKDKTPEKPSEEMKNPQTKGIGCWLFWVKQPFETVFQSISDHLSERGRMKRKRTDERKISNLPLPHLLQAQ